MIRPASPHASPWPTRIAVLALLGAMFIGACGNPPSPSPSVVASPSPSTSAAPSSNPPASPPAAVACTVLEIRATGGPWGGAAGSRGSDIVVENRGAAPCLLPAGPVIAIVDQGGTALMTSTPPPVGSGPELGPGGTIGFSLALGNWCQQPVSLPLRFRLALVGEAVDIEGLAVTTADDLPPCNGPGQPATLSTTAWQPG